MDFVAHRLLRRTGIARAARRFPVIFEAVADGRLNLSAVCLPAPHLTEDSAPELLSGAMGKSNAEIEKLLATRFPRPDVPAYVAPIPTAVPVAPAADLVALPGTGATAQAPVTLQAARPVDWADRSIVKPARSGEATVDGIRLLCRAHNQHAAERTFGAEFMRRKRTTAVEPRAEAVPERTEVVSAGSA